MAVGKGLLSAKDQELKFINQILLKISVLFQSSIGYILYYLLGILQVFYIIRAFFVFCLQFLA